MKPLVGAPCPRTQTFWLGVTCAVTRPSQNGLAVVCWKFSRVTTVCCWAVVFLAFSYAPKNQTWSFQNGPPRVYEFTGFTWSNFTRASESPRAAQFFPTASSGVGIGREQRSSFVLF